MVWWKDGTKWTFKLTSRGSFVYALDKIIDANGRGISFNWDAVRRLQSIVDDTSSTTLMTANYDASNQLTSVVDCYSRKIVYTYAASGDATLSGTYLQSVSQLASAGASNPPSRWSYTYIGYFGRPLLKSVIVPSPTGSGTSTATLEYDATGKATATVDANGNRTEFNYNNLQTVVTSKDSGGNVVHSWTQKFDAARHGTGSIDAAGNSDSIEFTDSANPYLPTRVVDADNRATVMTYDSKGNILTEKSPRNVTTNYSYDYSQWSQGRLVQVQEGSKPPVSFTYYEPTGFLQSVTAPHPNGSGTVTATYTYDALGNVTSITTPGNASTSSIITRFDYTQDGTYTQPAKSGQPLTITNNVGKVTHLRYDARGNVTSMWDALGNTTYAFYNIADQPTDIYLPRTCQTGNNRTRLNISYLYVGGPQSSTQLLDESGLAVRAVSYNYGKEGETLSVSGGTQPFSQVYDALYRIKTLTDAANRVTSYSYDTLGRLAKISLPGTDGTTARDTIRFPSYSPSGQLLQRVDGNGEVANYTYNDPEGQLTNIAFPSHTTQNVTYAYDSYGMPQSVTDQSGSESYAFNASDVLSGVTTTYKKADGTSLPAKTLTYTYNADGSRAGMSSPGGAFAYGYDSIGRALNLTNPQSQVTSWGYLDNNWLKSQTLGNGAVTTYTLNAIGQRLGVTNRNSMGAILSQFGHASDADSMLGYDGEGKLLKLKSIIAANTSLGGTTNYGYDGKNQLTTETSTKNGSYSNTFGYDATGNPTTWNVGGQNQVRTFNSNNQETTLNSGGQVQFVYDGNGNPTNYKGIATTYDVANHLTSFGTQLTAGYRSDGKRAWKQNSSGVRTYFLYDGDALLCELDGNGNVTYTNTWGANGLVSRRDAAASSTRFYTWDNQGSVAQRLDASGNVIDSFTFTAFGQKVGTGGDPYTGYNGQWGYYSDYETGLILCTHRYYDPDSGRWLTRDPIGYGGGLNLYAYVDDNPINATDSSGLIAYPRTPRQIDESNAWNQGFLSGLNDIGRNIGSVVSYLSDRGAFIPADVQQGQQIAQLSRSVRYVAVNGSYTLPNGVGYGGQVVYDCFGNRYWGHGPSGGGAGPSFSFVIGFMDTPARQDQLFDFLNESSRNWTVGN